VTSSPTGPLALLGGPPTVPRPGPHFTWPPITCDTVEAVRRQLAASISVYDRSGVIADLEEALAAYHGCAHAVLTSSGTAALHSMYAAAGLRAGDEVIVPAYTFFATATPLLHLGVTPVLADSDATGNLDPVDAARRITPRTAAIVVTHLWGIPADMTSLSDLADAHALLVFEDASHAHGATIAGRMVGTFGAAAAFSMNGPKPLSAGEGGFVLTDDDEIYHRVLLHGQYNKRCRTEIPSSHPLYRYATTGAGLKLRIHPLAAAIALDQLDHLDGYLTGRARTAAQLCEQLGRLPGLVAPSLPEGVRASWYGLPLLYRADGLGGLPIDRFHQALLAEGCPEVDRPGSTCPLNLLPLFDDPTSLLPDHTAVLGYRPGDFPTAEAVHAATLKLPVWHDPADQPLVDAYIAAFHKVINRYEELLP
jgi:perosamine synthetase